MTARASRTFRPHPTNQNIWIWFLGLGGLLTALYTLVPPFEGQAPMINLLGFISVAAIAVGIRLHQPRTKLAWQLFLVGQTLYFLGDIYTYLLPQDFGVNVPFPSWGDAIYLTVYPVLMAGLIVIVRRRNPNPDRASLIDSLILSIGISLLSWVFLIAPYIHLSDTTVLQKAVSMAYPLGDLLLLAAAIRLAMDAGRRQPAFYLLVSSIVCLLVTDSAYGYTQLTGAFTHQAILDVGWISYLLLWGAAALHPSMRTLEEPADDRRVVLTPARLGLLATACLIAPGILMVRDQHSPEVLVVLTASMLLFLLVVTRMAGLVRQEERAARRERALRRAGSELVGAASVEQVYAARSPPCSRWRAGTRRCGWSMSTRVRASWSRRPAVPPARWIRSPPCGSRRTPPQGGGCGSRTRPRACPAPTAATAATCS